MARLHAYTVKWRDSSAVRGWNRITTDQHGVSIITSIGWLLRRTKKEITITTSVTYDGSCMDPLTIPLEAVVKLSRLPQYIADV